MAARWRRSGRAAAKVQALLAEAIGHHQAGRLAQAEPIYRQILALEPDHFDASHFLGVMASQRGDHAAALRQIDLALSKNPDSVFALNNRGVALYELERFDEALASYDRALALAPDYAEALSNRGNALKEQRRFDEALASYDRALALRPDYAEALSNRGVALYELKRYDEALASCDRALALKPEHAEALSNRGNSLKALKRFDEALASYDRALALRPDFAEALTNRGNNLKELRRFDEAQACYDRALALRPDYAEAHLNAALFRLLLGDFDRGWKHYEWRWQASELRNEKRKFSEPQWTGSDEIAGKTILLHAEQGFGDTIQFCRYVPLVAARGARVILEAPAALQTLLGTLPGAAQVVAMGQPLPNFASTALCSACRWRSGRRSKRSPRRRRICPRRRTR